MNPTIQYRPLGRRLNVWEQNTWIFTFAIVLTRILRSKKPPAPWMTLFISKILYWGTSEWSGEQLQAVHALCQEHGYYPPQVEQPQYSLLVRRRFEEDVLPAAREWGMGLVTWSPLASGVLTGKYDQGFPEGSRLGRPELKWLKDMVAMPRHIDQVRKLKAHAEKIGISRTQLALAWLLLQPGDIQYYFGSHQCRTTYGKPGHPVCRLG